MSETKSLSYSLRHDQRGFALLLRRHERLERLGHARAQVRVLHALRAAHEDQHERHQVRQLLPVCLAKITVHRYFSQNSTCCYFLTDIFIAV